jgi:hypothetical protein
MLLSQSAHVFYIHGRVHEIKYYEALYKCVEVYAFTLVVGLCNHLFTCIDFFIFIISKVITDIWNLCSPCFHIFRWECHLMMNWFCCLLYHVDICQFWSILNLHCILMDFPHMTAFIYCGTCENEQKTAIETAQFHTTLLVFAWLLHITPHIFPWKYVHFLKSYYFSLGHPH